MKHVIYVDMDGVLVDFRTRWDSLYGTERGSQRQFKSNWKNFVYHERGFATADVLENAHELWDIVSDLSDDYHIGLLTSTAFIEDHAEIMSQKMEWWEDNFGDSVAMLFVPGKKYKQHFAEKNHILIDDTPSNIDQWIAAGGKGILYKHTEFESFVKQFDEALE